MAHFCQVHVFFFVRDHNKHVTEIILLIHKICTVSKSPELFLSQLY